MANVNNLFPSKYLKAADLQGNEVTVTIASFAMEPIVENEDPKPVLYFQGKQKGMVLNKTNTSKIAHAYGDETDNWVGQSIILYEDMVTFNNQMVPALRVRIPPRSGRGPAKPLAQSNLGRDLEDEVPFAPEWRG